MINGGRREKGRGREVVVGNIVIYYLLGKM